MPLPFGRDFAQAKNSDSVIRVGHSRSMRIRPFVSTAIVPRSVRYARSRIHASARRAQPAEQLVHGVAEQRALEVRTDLCEQPATLHLDASARDFALESTALL